MTVKNPAAVSRYVSMRDIDLLSTGVPQPVFIPLGSLNPVVSFTVDVPNELHDWSDENIARAVRKIITPLVKESMRLMYAEGEPSNA